MKKAMSMLIASVLILSFVTVVTGTTSAIGEKGWSITIDHDEPTDMFEGGNHTDFVFENEDGREDARFGVIWGTEENPNSIIMTTNQKRYLGRVSVEGEAKQGSDSEEIDEERFIKIGSMFGVKIGNIYEYETLENESVAPFTVDQSGEVDSSLGAFKYVNLREATWEPSEVEEIDGDGSTTNWKMSLTAEDLPYEPIASEELDPEFEDEKLDQIKFTFHLSATIEEREDVEIPQFSAEVESQWSRGDHNSDNKYGGHRLQHMERKGTQNGTALVGSYDIKWDKEIKGWDFDPENENPSLLLGFQNFFGNRIKDMEQWHKEFMHQSGENVRMETRDSQEGEFRAEFAVEQKFQERKLIRNRIEYGGDWSRAGMFSWVSNVTVDGEQKEATAQLFGGAPWMYPFGVRMNESGLPDFEMPEYMGFMSWGGLNYPGGEEIFHDPALSGEAYLDMSVEEEPDSLFGRLKGNLTTVLSFILVGAAIVIVIGAALYRRKDKGSARKERNDRENEEDWSEYYDRNR